MVQRELWESLFIYFLVEGGWTEGKFSVGMNMSTVLTSVQVLSIE